MALMVLTGYARACNHDSSSGFVGEVEAFTDLASANSKKHCPVASWICSRHHKLGTAFRVMRRNVTFKLSFEIKARGCEAGRLAWFNNKMFQSQ